MSETSKPLFSFAAPSTPSQGVPSSTNTFATGSTAAPATVPPLFGAGGAMAPTMTGTGTTGTTGTVSGFGTGPSAFGGFAQPKAATPIPGTAITGTGTATTPGTAMATTATTTPLFGPAASRLGGLFGTAPSSNLFGSPRPADSIGTATAPASGAQPGSSAPAATSSTSIFGGGNLFGPKPDAAGASTAPAVTTAVPATGTVPALTGVTSTSTSTSLFGGFGKKDDGADKTAGTATQAAPTEARGLFGSTATSVPSTAGFGPFGQSKDTTTAKPDENKTTTMTFGGAPAAAVKPTTGTTDATTTHSTTTAISVPPPSMLRGKTIEEIVNKWSSELETHVKEFNRLAGEIAVWDRALIDNGNTIAALFQHLVLVEHEQNDIEQSLRHVEDQQKELAATLDVYEKQAAEIFEGQGGSLRSLDVGPADAERDKNYTLAADLNSGLDDISQQLTQMINTVNALSDTSAEGGAVTTNVDAPLEQIAQILSSHLESLQWIDGAVREVESKVTEVERRVRDTSVAGARTPTNGSGSVIRSPFVRSIASPSPSGSPRPRGFGLGG